MLDAMTAKLTAGLAFRFESVISLAGSALAILITVGYTVNARPLTLLSQAARWLGLDWDQHLTQTHDWMAARRPVLQFAILAVVALTLFVAGSLANIAPPAVVENARWLIALTICAAASAEIDGPRTVIWVLAALALAAVLAALHTRQPEVFAFLIIGPFLLLLLPLGAFNTLLAAGKTAAPH
jgi:hypothetical protein